MKSTDAERELLLKLVNLLRDNLTMPEVAMLVELQKGKTQEDLIALVNEALAEGSNAEVTNH